MSSEPLPADFVFLAYAGQPTFTQLGPASFGAHALPCTPYAANGWPDGLATTLAHTPKAKHEELCATCSSSAVTAARRSRAEPSSRPSAADASLCSRAAAASRARAPFVASASRAWCAQPVTRCSWEDSRGSILIAWTDCHSPTTACIYEA